MLKRLAAACPASRERDGDPALAEGARRHRRQGAAQQLPPARRRSTGSPRSSAMMRCARRHFDVLANSAADIVRALAPRASPARDRLVAGFDRLLAGFEVDPALSRADRMGALIARIDLAGIDLPEAKSPPARLAAARSLKLSPALLADVREQAARADREITDGYERQAVITAAAYLLAHAGLIDESDALLKANLARSHSPYYLMTDLADNARPARRRTPRPLRWHREAYEKSTGPATRLQWGARYVVALIDLAPATTAAIEAAAAQLIDEAGSAAERLLRAQRQVAAARRRQVARLEPRRRARRGAGAGRGASGCCLQPDRRAPTRSARPATTCSSRCRRSPHEPAGGAGRRERRAASAGARQAAAVLRRAAGGACLSIRAMSKMPSGRRGRPLGGLVLALAAWAAGPAGAASPAGPPPAPPRARRHRPHRRVPAPWVHAWAPFGVTPKYPRGFAHFDYVDPDAVKGGTLYLSNPDRRTSFDKYNPFTIRGAAPGRRLDLHVRVAGGRAPATSRRRSTACSPRRSRSRPTCPRSRSGSTRPRASSTATRCWPPTSSIPSTC